MCLYALEKGNLLQATKCLDIIEKCQDNFKNKDGSYNYGGEGYDEKIIAYIREKTNDFSLNKLNYTQAEDDLTWLVGDMIDKKIENIQQEISNLADTPSMDYQNRFSASDYLVIDKTVFHLLPPYLKALFKT